MTTSNSDTAEQPETRVVVVDDSALFRLLMRDVLNSIPGCTVVGVAADGRAALDVINQLGPDLVTLDVEMPEMDGIQTLREIKRHRFAVRALMVSRLTESGARTTTDALLEGAFDFILKPSGGRPAENKAQLRDALEQKISALRESAQPQTAPGSDIDVRVHGSTPAAIQLDKFTQIDAVIIGTSTGGPDALRRVLPGLSAKLPVPVIVVQHMPRGYTGSLACRLNEGSAIRVVEAAQNEPLPAGTVSIVPGGEHMLVQRRQRGRVFAQLTDDPLEHGCRPAVDYTLRSAIEAFDGKLLSVIMTGMGHDGTEGCRILRSRGGEVFAQHPTGCVVYGMPRSVIEAGLANRVIRLELIAAAINRRVESAAR